METADLFFICKMWYWFLKFIITILAPPGLVLFILVMVASAIGNCKNKQKGMK